MDEVTKKWGNLSLTEREEVEHDLQDTELVEGAIIVAKFFTKRRVNLEAVATTLKTACRTDFSFEVRDLGENKAIFLFEDETDMYLVAVHKLGEKEQIQNICFDKVSFWVQLHDIPTRRMTRETGRLIKFGGPTPVWCGKLNHDEKDCGIWLRSQESLQPHDQQYGAWLKAKPNKLQRPQLKKKHDHLGELSEDGLEGKENNGASPTSSKRTWRWLNREATNTVAMEGVSTEKGPKRKLLPPLGETDPNSCSTSMENRDTHGKGEHTGSLFGELKRKSTIMGLMDESNQWQEDPEVKDKWTANPSTYCIVSPQRILPMEAKVSVLIDAKNGEWKVDLIRDVFLEHETDSILSIPVSTLLPTGKLVWSVAANGKFSVKSAYNLARSGEKKDRGKSSDSPIMKRFWQVIEDPICDACGLEPETVLHVLCQCSKAKEVWTHCRLLHLFEGKGDFTDILCFNGMNQDQDSNLLHMILMIAWGIWQNRNEIRHGEKWTPPPHRWYKVNTDGAVFSKQKGDSIGVIARDEQGRVVAAMRKRLQVPLGALEIEAKALEAAAVFAKDIGVQKAIFESDSLVVCSAI
ncbi:hypothetical protein ACB092_11G205800 [Castanea dentata]